MAGSQPQSSTNLPLPSGWNSGIAPRVRTRAASGPSASFQAPPSYAAALRWTGIDLVSVANNHAFDYFRRGLDQTQAALKKVGVVYTGLPGQVTVTTVKGVRVAVVGPDDTVHVAPIVVERDTGATFEVASGLSESDRVVKLASPEHTDGERVEVVSK